MKLTAVIVLSLQAPTLAEAGAKLDDVLAPARERDDIDVRSIELQTPSAPVPVTIPYSASPGASPAIAQTPLPRPGIAPG